MFRVIWGASLYAPASLFGEWSSSGGPGPAFCAQKVNIVAHCEFPAFVLPKLGWWVIWVCGCMAGGEQCASTSELWSVWEVMSQCGVIWLFW